MQNSNDLPNTLPVFPLSNFIIFPETTVPLNIFEPRYIQMIDDCMKSNRMLGMVQPKKTLKNDSPELFDIGCMGKITSFSETEDGRYLIVINGVSRFKIIKEINTSKLYRTCNVEFKNFSQDLKLDELKIDISELDTIFKSLKSLLKKQGYVINWEDLKEQNLQQTINTLSMASPFSLEEKQTLLETPTLKSRKEKLEEILKTYLLDNFSNTTIQ